METPSVTCYPQPGKPKSLRLCNAFAKGAGGAVVQTPVLQPGAAAFYGVMGIEGLLRQARAEARDTYYMDNAHFDRARQVYFRVEKNGEACAAGVAPDYARLKALGIAIAPWTRGGRHVVVVMQSDHFLREIAQWPGGQAVWQEGVLQALHASTDRPIVVRHWSRDKSERARSLHQDLAGAWALVTHASAAANEALLAGVPVFVTGRSAALPMGLSQLTQIENPRRPDGREEWAARLAAQQWTVEEIEAGQAWRTLNAIPVGTDRAAAAARADQ